MTGPLAARIALPEAPAAAILRLRTDVRAAIVADTLWLRGDRVDAILDRLLDFIAPHDRYELEADNQLRPVGHRLPVGMLPAASWRPVAELFAPAWPVPTARTPLPDGIALRLVRSDREQPANALLTSSMALERWVSRAAAIRLAPLRFAATTSHVLVLGRPVPPIAGVRLYESSGIVVPCGWQIAPAVDPSSLRRLLNLTAEDLALFNETGWQLVFANSIVGMSRSAVRLTMRGLSHG
jgi:hypothetical protein